jgi:predicted RNA-binding Zn-ribbon protein involved in translation (DUF1610 family)
MSRKVPSRLRRCLKWLGLLMCTLTAVAWLLSPRWAFACHSKRSMVGFGQGVVFVMRGDYPAPKRGMLDIRPMRMLVKRWGWRWPVLSVDGPSRWKVVIPLWIPFVLLAVPTAILLWRDRRLPPGHCNTCGYNLAGNVSGICPECGTKVRGNSQTRRAGTCGAEPRHTGTAGSE